MYSAESFLGIRPHQFYEGICFLILLFFICIRGVGTNYRMKLCMWTWIHVYTLNIQNCRDAYTRARCLYVHISIHVCIVIHARCLCMRISTCTRVEMGIHARCLYMRISICVYIHTRMHNDVYTRAMFIHAYIYTHIYLYMVCVHAYIYVVFMYAYVRDVCTCEMCIHTHTMFYLCASIRVCIAFV